MSQTEQQNRLQKLKNLTDKGVNPYPAQADKTHFAQDVLANFEKYKKQDLRLAGRIMILRSFGKLSFAKLKDATGKIQVVFEKKEIEEAKYKLLKQLDAGDIIQVLGQTFVTQKGEQSILVKDFEVLSKALEPLPEKWHGLKDEEARYRKRYLDILLNPELQEMFIKKAKFWQTTRDFLVAKDFQEVETPVLESTPGGADAEPFVTHHNALDLDLFLRISMGELWQKRLMVAGFERTFEIGRQFRNEGIDQEHLQDYTQMEFYMAYANYEQGMELVEALFKQVLKQTFGKLKFKIKDFDVDLNKPWEKIDFTGIIKEKLNIDVLEASKEELIKKCEELNLEVDKKMGKGRLMDTLWKSLRKKIAGPAFLINHPVEVSPLAKRKADDPRLVERFQVIIAGSELGNGYSELNDPLDQEERFKEQAKLREAGDAEAQMHDQDFVTALKHGMPPTCGFGMSERVFAFFMDKPVRECVLFPLLKPKEK